MSRHGNKMLGKANGPSTKKCRVAYAVPVGVQDTSLASSEPPQHQPTPDSPPPSTSSVSPPSVPQQMLFDETSALGAERDAALAERDHARAPSTLSGCLPTLLLATMRSVSITPD
ncbi:hypothetical protein KUCAC02_035181 [Chaenocephalus aceratus]|nr:hypothetical protein KUCAC02_035181 [Chaenocephalus aceratus]